MKNILKLEIELLGKEKREEEQNKIGKILQKIYGSAQYQTSTILMLDAVKVKRKVLAPYKENGKPKDWEQKSEGSFRLTHPSNIWT